MIQKRKETPVYQQKDSLKEQVYIRKNVKCVDNPQSEKTKKKHQILKKFLLWFFTLSAIQALIEALPFLLVRLVAICLLCSIIVLFVITIIRCIVWVCHKIQKKVTVQEQNLLFILSVFNITCFITLTHIYAIMGYFEYIS